MEKDYPLQYDGEFVLTKNGSKDFGEISQEIANEIHRQAGKIRLRRGVEIKGQKGNFCMKHIEREKRLTDLKNIGFENARDFVEYVCMNTEIFMM